MEKVECIEQAKNHALEMSDEKCTDCPYQYECRFVMDELNDVTCGGL